MNMMRFRDWKVYRDARILVKEVYEITSKFPQEFQFNLASQLNRAVLSIVLTIAEGSGKDSDKELNRFFKMAIGSINEVVAGLEVALDSKLVSQANFDTKLVQLSDISKQLGGFKKTNLVISY
jgi:four helix bundle protein